MGHFLAYRALSGLLTLFGASLVIFLILRVLPGDVAMMILIGMKIKPIKM